MKVIGIDFTSTPTRRKPLTCFRGSLEGRTLNVGEDALERWTTFAQFESALQRPGPWIAGIDCPFGQSRVFVENVGWPQDWAGYVEYVGSLSRASFRKELDSYRMGRSAGNKEHKRATDIPLGSVSPQKLYGVPVGLMFYEAAPRLKCSGATIPMLQPGDPERIVVEAYPGVLARYLIGRASYKNDAANKQTEQQRERRRLMLDKLLSGGIEATYGIRIQSSRNLEWLTDDPSGDEMDALLCAVQAAWAWTMRGQNYGAPPGDDTCLEGWIANPADSCSRRQRRRGPSAADLVTNPEYHPVRARRDQV